jgi:hypothetical protein
MKRALLSSLASSLIWGSLLLGGCGPDARRVRAIDALETARRAVTELDSVTGLDSVPELDSVTEPDSVTEGRHRRRRGRSLGGRCGRPRGARRCQRPARRDRARLRSVGRRDGQHGLRAHGRVSVGGARPPARGARGPGRRGLCRSRDRRAGDGLVHRAPLPTSPRRRRGVETSRAEARSRRAASPRRQLMSAPPPPRRRPRGIQTLAVTLSRHVTHAPAAQGTIARQTNPSASEAKSAMNPQNPTSDTA